ncbi:MAG: hypothetical protein AAF713_08225 [Pseudomonadota bacterium]
MSMATSASLRARAVGLTLLLCGLIAPSLPAGAQQGDPLPPLGFGQASFCADLSLEVEQAGRQMRNLAGFLDRNGRGEKFDQQFANLNQARGSMNRAFHRAQVLIPRSVRLSWSNDAEKAAGPAAQSHFADMRQVLQDPAATDAALSETLSSGGASLLDIGDRIAASCRCAFLGECR